MEPEVVSLLSTLIRFRTENPPGNEAEAVAWAKGLLEAAGLRPKVYARDPRRPNLVVRFPGKGEAPPLLVYGHLDVVPASGQDWSADPFSGEVKDGFVWGRGALDMKGPVAIYLAALLSAHARGELKGDVVLALLSDEEAGGDYGAKFLVEEHPELFSGIQHALGEFGAFTLHVAGKRFYPIMVAEKQIAWLRLTFKGPAGHGSLWTGGGAMARLGAALWALDRAPPPVHVTPVVRRMFEGLAEGIGGPKGALLKLALIPRLTHAVLGRLGEAGRVFLPLFGNTAAPTIVRGGEKINVVPGRVELELDGRLLPGFNPGHLVEELSRRVPVPFEADVIRFDPGPQKVDWTLFPLLAEVLEEADPGAKAIPLLLSGVTDGRHFARLGIQTYGFTPMKLPEGFAFNRLIHAADERIPVEALSFGVEAVRSFFRRLG